MNVKELMIGNWVKNKNDLPVRVMHIEGTMIRVDAPRHQNAPNRSHDHVENFSGVDLTASIVKSAGFKNGVGPRLTLPLKRDKYTCYLWLEFIDDRVYMFTVDDGHDYHLVDDIRQLHRLQNLYFAIMGVELKVDL